jgi:hypothetical protein
MRDLGCEREVIGPDAVVARTCHGAHSASTGRSDVRKCR